LLQQRFSGLGDLFGKFLLAGQDEFRLAGTNLVWEVSEIVVATASFFSLQRIRPNGGFSLRRAQCSRT